MTLNFRTIIGLAQIAMAAAAAATAAGIIPADSNLVAGILACSAALSGSNNTKEGQNGH